MDEWKRVLSMINFWVASLFGEAPEEPDEAALADSGALWTFYEGSATVFVWASRTEESVNLSIYAPILKMSADPGVRQAVCERMLRLNSDTLLNCAFAINDQDEVIVSSTRTTDDLSPVELEEMAFHVARFADRFDNELADEFGLVMLGEE